MTKEEQLDLLLDILTKEDFHKYEEIKQKTSNSGIDFSKIPKKELTFSAYRFLADMAAKAPELVPVCFINPKDRAEKDCEDTAGLARDIMSEIFCLISRLYEGVYTYNKADGSIRITFPDRQVYIISVAKEYR